MENGSKLINLSGLTEFLRQLKDRNLVLTDAQKTYLEGQMSAQTKASAETAFVVNTSISSPSTYYTDKSASTVMVATVTVTLTFSGTAVNAISTPSGWSNPSVGTYTYSLNTATTSVGATTFSYTCDGVYSVAGTISKNSAAKSISIVNPLWYGVFTASSVTEENIEAFISGATPTRATSSTSGSAGKFANNYEADGYLWIVTHNSATATQLSSSILNAPVTGQSFDQGSFRLTDYKVYVSTSTCAKKSEGGAFNGVVYSFNI